MRRRLAEKKLSLRLTEAAKELLAEVGFDPAYGARPLKRAIQKYLQDPLALRLLEGQFKEGESILADVKRGHKELTFTKDKQSKAA